MCSGGSRGGGGEGAGGIRDGYLGPPLRPNPGSATDVCFMVGSLCTPYTTSRAKMYVSFLGVSVCALYTTSLSVSHHRTCQK